MICNFFVSLDIFNSKQPIYFISKDMHFSIFFCFELFTLLIEYIDLNAKTMPIHKNDLYSRTLLRIIKCSEYMKER